MGVPENDKLRLTDFVDRETLQEIQDSFAAVAQVKATITDADGNVLTQPAPTKQFLRRQRALAEAAGVAEEGAGQPQRDGAEYVAPILVADQRVGTIRMSASATPAPIDEGKLQQLAEKFGLDLKQLKSLSTQLARASGGRAAAIQFLFLLANAIARMCFQEYQLRQRIHEITAVYSITMMLSEARNLQKVLARAAQFVAELMEAKAASIRLLDEEQDELVIKAVYNLSPQYLDKGPIRLSRAEIDREALTSDDGFAYVPDVQADPRTQYPQEAAREGIVSMLTVVMRHQGRSIGVLRVYTDHEQRFSPLKIDLLKAVAAQAAAAIENTRLLEEAQEAEKLEKEVRLAGAVQQRMIPRTPPAVPGIDLSTVYVPCYTLGGDFYDLIPLPGNNLGVAIADVSGKGVPASLTMASVRAFLRAQVDNVYYLYEVVKRINLMCCRDMGANEFVTLFYGVLDASSRRFTYCNAGHPPAMLLRDGQVSELRADNLVLGVDPDEQYTQSIIDLQFGDTLVLYTDGLADGRNFADEPFGRQRIIEALSQGGETAEAIAQNVLWQHRKFVGMAKQTDDVTMIVVKVK